jgi:hypothetical protein
MKDIDTPQDQKLALGRIIISRYEGGELIDV